MREADQGIRPSALDHRVRELVRPMHVARHAILRREVAMTAGRKLAGDPPVRGVDARLVDRAPDVDEIAELVDDAMHERDEGAWCVGRDPSSFAHEPEWVREVVQGDHRRDPLLAHLAEHVSVVTDLARVEDAFRRLDPRPLDGKPVGILLQLAQQRDVFAVTPVAVARNGGGVALRDSSSFMLPLPPIAVAVVTFDLVRRAGGPPQKAFGNSLTRLQPPPWPVFPLSAAGCTSTISACPLSCSAAAFLPS